MASRPIARATRLGPCNSHDSAMDWLNSGQGKMSRSGPARFRPDRAEIKYTIRAKCPQCGRQHITVFRLRHVSDGFFVQLGQFFRFAKHIDFRRLRWCANLGQHPDWRSS